MNEQRFSQEQLNAFVDGELSAEDKEQIFRALGGDEAMNREVCEIRKLKDMLRHAYAEPPPPPSAAQRPRRPRWLEAAVAVLLLAVGATSGWFGHLATDSGAFTAAYQRQDLDAFQTVQLLSAQGKQQNVILHLTTADPHKLQYALDEVESLLQGARAKGLPVKLEVVANDDGLTLLRSQSSPYPERTEQLIQAYDNLTIMACANALNQLKQQGVDTRLLPHVTTTKSALERVVDRLQEGWLYIKV